jgi:hypothetical protein
MLAINLMAAAKLDYEGLQILNNEIYLPRSWVDGFCRDTYCRYYLLLFTWGALPRVPTQGAQFSTSIKQAKKPHGNPSPFGDVLLYSARRLLISVAHSILSSSPRDGKKKENSIRT